MPQSSDDLPAFYTVSKAPNWYHYYTQVYPGTGANSPFSVGSLSYFPSAVHSETDGYQPYDIHIGDIAVPNANATQITFPVFELDSRNPSGFVQQAGTLTVPSGMLSYIYTVSHEHGHQVAALDSNIDLKSDGSTVQPDGTVPPAGTVLPNIYYTKTINGVPYPIYDYLQSSWKASHHLDRFSNNTVPNAYPDSWVYQVGADRPDNELVADIQALGQLFQFKDLWRKDWSDQGIQCYTDTNTGSLISSRMPSQFLGVPGSNLPPDAYVKFTPLGGIPENVFSLSDLQDKVDPSGKVKVLSSLSGLN